MYKLKTVIDGLPQRREPDGDGPVAKGRYAPIPIDDIVPIDGDPKTYLEGRVAFYIALLEELVRRGADVGDHFFVKECLDALMKMTNVGRAKVDLNVGGGLSKLRDEIDFSNMSKAELEDFVSKAKGEVNVRSGGSGDSMVRTDSLHRPMDDIEQPGKSRRRRKGSRNNDGSGGEANASIGNGTSESQTESGPGSVATDLP